MNAKVILKVYSQQKYQILSSISMSTISQSKSIKNKHAVCRGKECMKKFCESLKEYAELTFQN